MANFPTVLVTAVVKDQAGDPIEGATVSAKLSTIERHNGYVVPVLYSGRTNSEGGCTLSLFPNELGSEGSEYVFTITPPSGEPYNIRATVPNSDCFLHDITELEPYKRRGVGQIVPSEVAGNAQIASDSAAEAESHAAKAFEHVESAEISSEEAKRFAAEAREWAESPAYPGDVTGAKSAKRWSDETVETSNYAIFRMLALMRRGMHDLEIFRKQSMEDVHALMHRDLKELFPELEEYFTRLSELAVTSESAAIKRITEKAKESREELEEVRKSVIEHLDHISADEVLRALPEIQEMLERLERLAGQCETYAKKAGDRHEEIVQSQISVLNKVEGFHTSINSAVAGVQSLTDSAASSGKDRIDSAASNAIGRIDAAIDASIDEAKDRLDGAMPEIVENAREILVGLVNDAVKDFEDRISESRRKFDSHFDHQMRRMELRADEIMHRLESRFRETSSRLEAILAMVQDAVSDSAAFAHAANEDADRAAVRAQASCEDAERAEKCCTVVHHIAERVDAVAAAMASDVSKVNETANIVHELYHRIEKVEGTLSDCPWDKVLPIDPTPSVPGTTIPDIDHTHDHDHDHAGRPAETVEITEVWARVNGRMSLVRDANMNIVLTPEIPVSEDSLTPPILPSDTDTDGMISIDISEGTDIPAPEPEPSVAVIDSPTLTVDDPAPLTLSQDAELVELPVVSCASYEGDSVLYTVVPASTGLKPATQKKQRPLGVLQPKLRKKS